MNNNGKPTGNPPLVVGVDLGGTNMQVGLVDGDNKILASNRRKTKAPLGQDAVLDRLTETITATTESGGRTLADLSAVGIAAPGAIDIPNGVVLEAPNLGWSNVPLRTLMEKRLGCPVVIDNDVNAAVWGEHQLGAARGHDDVLGVWVGTGIGGGLVFGGRLYHGPLFTAGEVGQIVVDPEGPEDRRVLEDFSSRSGMSRIIEERLGDWPDSVLHEITKGTGRITGSKKLARAVDADDPLAIQVVDAAAQWLGVAIANWVTVLALDRVVIGGGIAEALGPPFLKKIRSRFCREVFPSSHQRCELVMTDLADDAGLLGAAMLAGAAALCDADS